MRRGPSAINLLLGVDKPSGITSHDVVNHVRRAVGERRVGHAGTLDPAATGVMVLGVGQGTRLMGLLSAERKSYLATIGFGCETDTEDAEGQVISTAEVPAQVGSQEHAAQVVAQLVGDHLQVPPAYSAISVDGVRSYARARAGQKVELPPRPIHVYEAALLAVESAGEGCLPGTQVLWHVAITVSKGTYVRSIARDLGRQLGSAAHLEQLRRTVSGTVTLGDCIQLNQLQEAGAQFAVQHAIDPLRVLGLPVREVSPNEREDAAMGRRIALGSVFGVDARSRSHLLLRPLEGQLPQGQKVALFSDSRLWGVWEVDGGHLRSSVNFPVGIQGVSPCSKA